MGVGRLHLTRAGARVRVRVGVRVRVRVGVKIRVYLPGKWFTGCASRMYTCAGAHLCALSQLRCKGGPSLYSPACVHMVRGHPGENHERLVGVITREHVRSMLRGPPGEV